MAGPVGSSLGSGAAGAWKNEGRAGASVARGSSPVRYGLRGAATGGAATGGATGSGSTATGSGSTATGS